MHYTHILFSVKPLFLIRINNEKKNGNIKLIKIIEKKTVKLNFFKKNLIFRLFSVPY